MRCKIPAADLAQKLNDTICRYKGEAVYVSVSREGGITIYDLENRDKHLAKIKASDPDFDISSPPLGYFQRGLGEVLYLTRTPVRKTKQGLAPTYIRARRITNDEHFKFNSHDIWGKPFKNMVKGRYPHLGDALKKLREQYKENQTSRYQVAISRNIAMWIDEMGRINIYYKGDFVGWMQPDKNVVHVPNNDMGWVISKYLSHELSWEID